MPTFSNQSVTLAELLDAVGGLIRAATLLGSEQVVEWHFKSRPSVNSPSPRNSTVVWFQCLDAKVDWKSGAGRDGFPTDFLFSINIATRNPSDGVMRDKKIGRMHLAMRFVIENAFFGQMLFQSYNNAVGANPPLPTYTIPFTDQQREDRREGVADAIIGVLTIATMTAEKLPAMEHSRPEQGWVETRIGVGIKSVLRLSLEDTVTLEDE